MPQSYRRKSKPPKPREFFRNGPDHRYDRTVTFSELRQDFQLQSIKVGGWVTRSEQEIAAPRFYDGLSDLMLVLGGTPELISLRGSLSLHYGTGGQRGVAAHYEPRRQVLAIAKNAGPGSIAHEWFHGLDHYLADKVYPGAASGQFASVAWLQDEPAVAHPLASALGGCFRTIMLDETGREASALFQASAEADKTIGQLYYSRPEEMAARAFEAFVQDAPLTNHFLVKGTKASPEARSGLYPSGKQRIAINAAFNNYFKMLGNRLQRLRSRRLQAES